MRRTILLFTSLLTFTIGTNCFASGTLSEETIASVNKQSIEQEKLSVVAGYLAEYEIAAKGLIAGLSNQSLNVGTLNNQATQLLNLSVKVIDSAKFRLPQCDAYLTKTMDLIAVINSINNADLEKDFHHDGALPEAPAECYHTKDLFVHPATVLVHTRDNPSLPKITRDAVHGEIAEVLTHLELVRQLVVY